MDEAIETKIGPDGLTTRLEKDGTISFGTTFKGEYRGYWSHMPAKDAKALSSQIAVHLARPGCDHCRQTANGHTTYAEVIGGECLKCGGTITKPCPCEYCMAEFVRLAKEDASMIQSLSDFHERATNKDLQKGDHE